MSPAQFGIVLMTITTLATVQTKDYNDHKTQHETNTTFAPTITVRAQFDPEKDAKNKTFYYSSFKFEDGLDAEELLKSGIVPRRLKISTLLGLGRNRTIGAVQQNQFKTNGKLKASKMRSAVRVAAGQGFDAMMELYGVREPGIIHKGFYLDKNHPAAKLSEFNAPTDENEQRTRAAYASLVAAKKLKNSYKLDFSPLGRAAPPKISLRRTPLEGLCPARTPPLCPPASRRYRTLDGTCNNIRKPRWGSAQMPFHRFLAPAYSDGIETVRRSTAGNAQLASARFISLLVHGSKDEDAPVTLMMAQWGQFIDHDVTSTAQPRSVNGSVVRCCGVEDQHPFCLPIKVPKDDPWLSPLNVQCLEFLRSAPAQRQDCTLSWREQTNQVTSYLDASTVYSSNTRSADNARLFHGGFIAFGRGPPAENVCLRGGLANQCTRLGDARASEQPGLLAVHHVIVGEHNRIADELGQLNGHWSDEKLYQETRRIIGAMVQHITYREFLTLVLGREVCRLFDLELMPDGYYHGYDVKVNPTVANSFSAAAFRFGHSMIQGSYMRSTQNHQFIDNNVTLHEENSMGDIGTVGSLHRLLRGLAIQRSQKRDEFITPELTNHLFQTGSFPFGLDLAAINIQRGRDHGVPAYTQWREPCGLSPIRDWNDLEKVVGIDTGRRIQQGYRTVDDIDLFVAGIAERPVIGGLVGPTFACIIAQQFSNLRKGDRFWYENSNFESSFTPAQLQSIRQVSLAQLICRSLGGGTLQPHVFLPHDIDSNERRLCGTGSLSPIDLKPWLERDPSLIKQDSPPFLMGSNDVRKQSIQPALPSTGLEHKVLDKIDFIPNGAIGVQRPNDSIPIKLGNKLTPVDSKLDFKAKIPSTTKRPIRKTTKRSVSTTKRTITKKPTTKITRPTEPVTTRKSVRTPNKHKRKIKTTHHKQKRDAMLQDSSQNMTKSKTLPELQKSNLTIQLKQTLIVRPDHDAPYEIEINIRPNKHNRPNDYQYYYNKRPNYSASPTQGPTYFGRPQQNIVTQGQSRPDYGISNHEPTDNYNQKPSRPIFEPTADYDNGDRTTTDSYYADQRPEFSYQRPIHGNQQPEWTTYRPIDPRPEYYDRPSTQKPSYRPEPNYQSLDPAWDNSVTVRPTYRPHKNQPNKLDFEQTTYEHYHSSTPFSYMTDNNGPTYWEAKKPVQLPVGYNNNRRPMDKDSYVEQTVKRPAPYRPTKLDFDSPFSTAEQTQQSGHANIVYLNIDSDDWEQPTTHINSRLEDFQSDSRPSRPSSILYVTQSGSTDVPTTTTSRYQNYLPGVLLSNFATSLSKLFSATTTPTTVSPVMIQFLKLQHKTAEDGGGVIDDLEQMDDPMTNEDITSIKQNTEDLTNNDTTDIGTTDGQLGDTNRDETTIINFKAYETDIQDALIHATKDQTKQDKKFYHQTDTDSRTKLSITTDHTTTDQTESSYKILQLLPGEITTDNDDYSNLDLTTPIELTTTDIPIDDINTTILFDLDGYLRPEHMHFGEPVLIKPSQPSSKDDIVTETQIDDYVLPSLTKLQNKNTENRLYIDTTGRHSDTEILSGVDEHKTIIARPKDLTKTNDYDKITETKPQQQTIRNISGTKRCPHFDGVTLDQTLARDRKLSVPNDRLLIVPFDVLTKPERPDNWVMFHAMQKVSLPSSPLLEAVENAVREMPTPIKAIWRRFQHQDAVKIHSHKTQTTTN